MRRGTRGALMCDPLRQREATAVCVVAGTGPHARGLHVCTRHSLSIGKPRVRASPAPPSHSDPLSCCSARTSTLLLFFEDSPESSHRSRSTGG